MDVTNKQRQLLASFEAIAATMQVRYNRIAVMWCLPT
jgi:hypothetical protein